MDAGASLSQSRGRLILIGQYDSPFVRRVAVAMTYYGIAYEHRPWSVWSDADAISVHNPLRRVPVLVFPDGEALVESFAILEALDEMVSSDQALLPRAGASRRVGLRVCALATGLADKAISLLYERLLRTADGRNTIWMDRCIAQIRDTLDVLERERALRREAFWLGAFSHADVALACVLRFVGEAHPSLLTELPRPALAAHAARCEAMESFQRVAQPLHVAV